MKKAIIVAGVLVAVFAALRRFGPALRERAMKKCEQMFEHMPEDFPPKRMMRGIEEIRQQNVEILHQLSGPRRGGKLAAVD
jgi:hypothetical protein